jgi:hypothetical protein
MQLISTNQKEQQEDADSHQSNDEKAEGNSLGDNLLSKFS